MIRLCLMLTKIVRSLRVRVSEQDLREAFEALYGEQVSVRVIAWPKEERQAALDQYARLRKDSEEAFAQAARSSEEFRLRSLPAGRIRSPSAATISSDKILEEQAFKLRPGQVSEVDRQVGDGRHRCSSATSGNRRTWQSTSKPSREELLKAGYRAGAARRGPASRCLRPLLQQSQLQRSLVDEDSNLAGRPERPRAGLSVGQRTGHARGAGGEFLIRAFGEERLEFLVNMGISSNGNARRNGI